MQQKRQKNRQYGKKKVGKLNNGTAIVWCQSIFRISPSKVIFQSRGYNNSTINPFKKTNSTINEKINH
jgi:hypothetical protein